MSRRSAKNARLSRPYASTSARATRRSPTVCATACERTQPQEERGEAEQDPERGEHVGEPARQLAPVQLDAEHDGARGGECGGDGEQRPRRARIAGDVEAPPVPHECREERERDDRRLLEVEALREMRDGGCDHDHDAELPRAAAAMGERAREPDERDPERERADARSGDAPRREHAADDLEAVAHLGVSAEAMPITPTAAAAQASSDSGLGRRSLTAQRSSGTRGTA